MSTIDTLAALPLTLTDLPYSITMRVVSDSAAHPFDSILRAFSSNGLAFEIGTSSYFEDELWHHDFVALQSEE